MMWFSLEFQWKVQIHCRALYMLCCCLSLYCTKWLSCLSLWINSLSLTRLNRVKTIEEKLFCFKVPFVYSHFSDFQNFSNFYFGAVRGSRTHRRTEWQISSLSVSAMTHWSNLISPHLKITSSLPNSRSKTDVSLIGRLEDILDQWLFSSKWICLKREED